MIMKLFLALTMLTTIQPVSSQDPPTPSSKPEIISIDTGYPKDEIWVAIPKGTKEITFQIEANNTETVLFWVIPTGTETSTERKLIGYDIQESQNDHHFSLTWTIDEPDLLDHLHIQAIGEGQVADDLINLYME